MYSFGACAYCITKFSVSSCSKSYSALNSTAFGVPHLNSSHLWENVYIQRREYSDKEYSLGGWSAAKCVKCCSLSSEKNTTSDVTTGCFFFDLKDIRSSGKICPNAS